MLRTLSTIALTTTTATTLALVAPSNSMTPMVPTAIAASAQDSLHAERLLTSMERQLDQRELRSARNTFIKLSRLPIRGAEFNTLESRLIIAEQAIEQLLVEADAARAANDWNTAIQRVASAESRAVDAPDLAQLRRAIQNEQKADAAQRAGILAMDAGDYANAVTAFHRALERQATAETNALLDEALIAQHRQQLDAALRDDNLNVALQHAKAWQRLESTPSRANLIDQLQAELAADAQRRAQLAAADGRPSESVRILRDVLALTSAPALQDAMLGYEHDILVKQATSADQAGDYITARDLYLQAISRDPSNTALAARINDVEPIAQLQARTRDAEEAARDAITHASNVESDLHRAEATIGELESSLYNAVSDVKRLDRIASSLSRDVDHKKRRIYDLECEVDRLCDRIRRLERDLRDARRRRHDHDD
ncbi:MAG: hypothetical protein AAF432_06740 [Planctomycetota bacterium]